MARDRISDQINVNEEILDKYFNDGLLEDEYEAFAYVLASHLDYTTMLLKKELGYEEDNDG
ncbi:MAG: hypothetical protein LKF36_15320 [Lactobacillus sp.]|jgi:hypothetical protein|nr:hypothetical protein [Lactobacillus sp.]